ncbi:hypothetical protein [Arthrobacter sp. CJ23]|uniref:hypothetical protein n=1 Tax=Arthrobacter sp. CJ23 TaxID=2972479 RepID=UPI00215BEE79|nr:hypothetical protein [Arthrobacter sp. CJ23]UVJ39966.1 hypothetical protein NVV90_01860 [Arthrobacter sp. CJ23]
MTLITRHSRVGGRLLLGAILAASLALSACSFPQPTVQSTQTSPPSSAAPSSAAPSNAATDQASGGAGGVFGAFGSMSEACIAVSATMLSVTILPLAGLMGGKSEDVEKAQAELAKMQGQVPDELKPHFEKLKAFTESAGSDFSKYGSGEFEEAMKPIEDWLDKNCK